MHSESATYLIFGLVIGRMIRIMNVLFKPMNDPEAPLIIFLPIVPVQSVHSADTLSRRMSRVLSTYNFLIYLPFSPGVFS